MGEVRIIIIEATGEVNPRDWMLQNSSGKLIIPLAGGEYRRMIKNGAKPVYLYVVNNKGIEGWGEEPFYHERLNVIDRYFDIHQPYKNSGELVKVIGSTNSKYYNDLPAIGKWDRMNFVKLHNEGKVGSIYCMGSRGSTKSFRLRFIDRQTNMEKITIQGYRVIGNSDNIEGRGSSIDIAYTTNELTAQKIAKGRGIMGGDATVKPFNKSYTLYETFEQFEEDRAKGIKAIALSKLTEEEKKALGL